MYHILEHVIDALAINEFYHRRIYLIIYNIVEPLKKSRQSQTDRQNKIKFGSYIYLLGTRNSNWNIQLHRHINLSTKNI